MNEPSEPLLAGCKVLVVEDEYFLADDICRALRRAGAVVVGPFRELSEGTAAVEATPDLSSAVLDVNLDGTMVFPLADMLRGRGIPFVFTTGYDEGAIPAAYRDVPRYEKPVDAGSVARVLVTQLGGARQA